MVAIIEQRRSSAPMSEQDDRKNILFHIAQVDGLSARPGWTPLPGTYISLERLDVKETYDTEHKRITPGMTEWSENLPILHTTDRSRIRFLIKHQALLNKRSVLGSTELFSIRELLDMQKAADNEPERLVKLLVTLDPNGIRSPPSPKSPKSRRSSISGVLNISPRTSLEINRPVSPVLSTVQNSPTSPAQSLVNTPVPPRYATLYIAIRETAVDPKMNNRVTAVNWKIFVEACRDESLDELKVIVQKLSFLRDTFEEDSNCICLIDIVLGAIEATKKMLADPETMNVNRHISHAMMSIDAAFTPYQSLSRRKLAKRGESSVLLLQQMLSSVMGTMWVVGLVFAAGTNAVLRDRLETRVISWTEYFQQCVAYLNGESDKMPTLPPHKTSSPRIECPKIMGPNTHIQQPDMLSMVLPDVNMNEFYDQPETVRLLSEWAFSSTLGPPPTQEVVNFANPNQPNSRKPMKKKPMPLVLKDDNFSHINGIPLTPMPDEHATHRGLPVNNLFCLSGAAGSGKTQLAARMCEWLLQMKCLGGYFTFDRSTMPDVSPSFSQSLLALPMTLIHQMSTVEPESIGWFTKALTFEPLALQDLLEKKFEKLFVEPVREFASTRSHGNRNPLDPLVFIIDGVGNSDTGGMEEQQATKTFVDWICSSSVGRLPRHIKFLVLMRSDTKVERLLRERGVKILEMKPPIVRFVKEFVGSDNMVGGMEGGWASNASMKQNALRAGH